MNDLFNNSVTMSSILFLCFVLCLIALTYLTRIIKDNLDRTLSYLYYFYQLCALPVLVFFLILFCFSFIIFSIFAIIGIFCLLIAEVFVIQIDKFKILMKKIKQYYLEIIFFKFKQQPDNIYGFDHLKAYADALNNDADGKTFLMQYDQNLKDKQVLSNLDIPNK